ncbi:hypothetical protein KUCAC02_000031, partial [Chaenocephalus aceratus]
NSEIVFSVIVGVMSKVKDKLCPHPPPRISNPNTPSSSGISDPQWKQLFHTKNMTAGCGERGHYRGHGTLGNPRAGGSGSDEEKSMLKSV